jgi:hypothetical protein
MQSPTATTEPPSSPDASGTRRRRGVLAGLALVLACLTIVIATVAIWIHQVALDNDRFTAIVTDVVDEPAVIDPIAARVSRQVVTALDIEGRIADRLPDAARPLAGSIAVAVEEGIERRLQTALADPRVQNALLQSLSFTHDRVVAFLRGETTAITIVDGYAQLNVFPVVGAALAQLQSIGLIPADVVLPDLTSDEAPAALAERLESRLGVTLPPGFGTVQLTQADRLATAQTFVRVFDIVVAVLVVLSVLLAVLAVWLARDRRRMVVYLAIGTIVAFIVARFALRSVLSAVVDGIADQGLAAGIRSVLDATVGDLVAVTTVILVVTGAIAVVAYVAGRPAWLVRLASRSSMAVSATASRTTAAATDAGSRAEIRPFVRDNQGALERLGVAAILFAVAWIAIGFEVALLGAALVGAWLLVVRIVTGEPDDAIAADVAGPDA